MFKECIHAITLCTLPPFNQCSSALFYYLGKGTDSVLTGKQRWVFSNLKIKIHCFVCESRKLIAEAKFVCPVSGGSEGETVILFLHLLVQHLTVRIFQSTIYIVVTTSDHLEESYRGHGR